MTMAPLPRFVLTGDDYSSPPADVRERLRSGRVLAALAVPVGWGHIVSWLWIATALSGTGAVFRNGGFVFPAGVDVNPAVLGGPLVVEWIAVCWGLTSAIAVIADEAQGRPPGWRTMCSWPWRHPAALLTVAALLVLVTAALLVVAVAVVWVLAAAGRVFTLIVVTLSAVATLAALVPLARRVLALLVVGTPRRPGLVHSVPPMRGTARAAGRMVWWSGCGAGGLVLLVTEAGPDRSGWPSWTEVLILIVIAVAFAAVAIVAITDDVLPDGLRPFGAVVPRSRALRRWTVAVAAVVVPMLLVGFTPYAGWWQIISYQEASGRFADTETEVVAAGGRTLILGEDRTGRTVAVCEAGECESAGDLDMYTDQTLSADGATVWVAHWEQAVDDHGIADPTAEVALNLDSYAAAAYVAQLTEDDADPAARLTSSTVFSTTAGVLHPGASHQAPGAQGVLAVAEHDGTVAVLATGSGGASSPLYLARCTAGECVTAQTTISRDWVTTYSGGAVGIGPDGTVYAVIDEAGMADDQDQDRGLVVATLSSSGDLGTQFLPEIGDQDAYTSGQGVSLAVGSDGSVWMLHLASLGRAELIRCDDAACASRTRSEHSGIEQGTGALAVDSTGRPLIASVDETHTRVHLLGCADRGCAELSQITLWDEVVDPDAVGRWTYLELGLGLDGDRPVIVVAGSRDPMGGSHIIRCTAARCGAD